MAGIRQDGPPRDIADMVRRLTFDDPDRNVVTFYQDLTANSAAVA